MRGEGTNPTRLEPTFSTSHNQQAELSAQHSAGLTELGSALLQPGGSFAAAAPELEPGWQCRCGGESLAATSPLLSCPQRPVLLQTLSPLLLRTLSPLLSSPSTLAGCYLRARRRQEKLMATTQTNRLNPGALAHKCWRGPKRSRSAHATALNCQRQEQECSEETPGGFTQLSTGGHRCSRNVQPKRSLGREENFLACVWLSFCMAHSLLEHLSSIQQIPSKA